MDHDIKPRNFSRTHAAIDQFEATRGERNGLWNTVETNADVDAAQAADEAAVALVQAAFHADTAHINSLEHCRRVDVKDIKQMTGWKAR